MQKSIIVIQKTGFMGEVQLSDAVGWKSVRGSGMLMPKHYSDKWPCLRNLFFKYAF